jgi:hypothetical protein
MAVPFGFREKPLSIVEIIEAFEKGPVTGLRFSGHSEGSSEQ